MHSMSLPTLLKQTSFIRSQVYLIGLATCFLIFQFAANLAKAAPESFAPLVEIVSPAVVNITTSTTVSAPVGPQGIVPREVHLKICSVIFKIVMGVRVHHETHPHWDQVL